MISWWFFLACSSVTRSILFCRTMRFVMPVISRAVRCSTVCGCGQCSFAEMRSSAPSMMFAPESIVAMRLSWPGASTRLIFRTGCVWLLQCGQAGLTEYACGGWHVLHL